MPYFADGHGATLTFDGRVLGDLLGIQPAFQAANVHEVTGVASPIVGSGQNARILRQYNVTSIDSGVITARFLGSPSLSRNDMGYPATLTVAAGTAISLSGQAVCIQLDADIQVGELVRWNAVFQFTGF